MDVNKPILVFQTDFTYKEGAVSSMYGVVKTVDRSLEIFDGTHEIPQYDTWSASYRLYQTMRFWPKGTIFVSVVDPGVGTPRKACVARTADGYFIVSPDNGSLTHIATHVGITEVRQIDERTNRLVSTTGTSVFHGRDLFGYCAARLASGIISYEQVGPTYPVGEIVRHPMCEPVVEGSLVKGIFEIHDPNFGNLWSNIPRELFEELGFRFGDQLHVTVSHGDSLVFEQDVLYHMAFGYVGKGQPIIYVNELMHIAMALCMDNLCVKHQLGFGSDWKVAFRRA